MWSNIATGLSALSDILADDDAEDEFIHPYPSNAASPPAPDSQTQKPESPHSLSESRSPSISLSASLPPSQLQEDGLTGEENSNGENTQSEGEISTDEGISAPEKEFSYDSAPQSEYIDLASRTGEFFEEVDEDGIVTLNVPLIFSCDLTRSLIRV